MGKGSRRRPSAISQSEFDRRWALAFGKHDRKPRKGNVKVRLKAIGGVKMQFVLNDAVPNDTAYLIASERSACKITNIGKRRRVRSRAVGSPRGS